MKCVQLNAVVELAALDDVWVCVAERMARKSGRVQAESGTLC